MNCINCGAPHNGHRCNYCGTYYTNNIKVYNKIDKLNKGKIKANEAFKMSAGTKLVLLLLVLAMPFLFTDIMKHKKKV